MIVPYASSALERIRTLGEAAIASFVGGLSAAGDDKILPLLPPAAGFRPGTKPGIRRSKALLVGFLAKPEGSKKQQGLSQRALYSIWKQWGREKLGLPEEISDLFDRLDTAKPESHDALGAELFFALQQLSLRDGCFKEDVEKFFQFSPFTASPAITTAVAACKPQSMRAAAGTPEIEGANDERLGPLKDRIQKTESEWQQVEARLIKRVEDLEHSQEARTALLEKKLEELGTNLGQRSDTAKADGEAIRNEVLELVAELETRVGKLGDRAPTQSALDAPDHPTRALGGGNKAGIDREGFRIDDQNSGAIDSTQALKSVVSAAAHSQGVDAWSLTHAVASLIAGGVCLVEGRDTAQISALAAQIVGGQMVARASIAASCFSFEDLLRLACTPLSPSIQGAGTVGEFLQFAESMARPTVLLLDGINRAPIETFASELLRITSPGSSVRTYSWRDREGAICVTAFSKLMAIGVLVEGSAVFKVPLSLANSMPLISSQLRYNPPDFKTEFPTQFGLTTQLLDRLRTTDHKIDGEKAAKLRELIGTSMSLQQFSSFVSIFAECVGAKKNLGQCLLPLLMAHVGDPTFMDRVASAISDAGFSGFSELAKAYVSIDLSAVCDTANGEA